MEIADGGTHENQVQANAFLQYAQEQCLQQYNYCAAHEEK